MNKDRRNKISNLINRIEDLKSDLDLIKEEEQDALDNLSGTNFEYSSRAEAMEEAVDQMDTAMDSLEEAIDALMEVC